MAITKANNQRTFSDFWNVRSLAVRTALSGKDWPRAEWLLWRRLAGKADGIYRPNPVMLTTPEASQKLPYSAASNGCVALHAAVVATVPKARCIRTVSTHSPENGQDAAESAYA